MAFATSTAAATSVAQAHVPLRGVHEPHHGSLRGPTKVRSLQGKRPAGSWVRALWWPGWTHPPFAAAGSTATTGHGLRPPSRRRLAGVHGGDHGPFRRSPENGRLQGKAAGLRGFVPFWGQQWTRLPFRADLESVPDTRQQGRPVPNVPAPMPTERRRSERWRCVPGLFLTSADRRGPHLQKNRVLSRRQNQPLGAVSPVRHAVARTRVYPQRGIRNANQQTKRVERK
jgi:hypothetical protein